VLTSKSWKLSGSGEPSVSGRRSARTPPTADATPKMVKATQLGRLPCTSNVFSPQLFQWPVLPPCAGVTLIYGNWSEGRQLPKEPAYLVW